MYRATDLTQVLLLGGEIAKGQGDHHMSFLAPRLPRERHTDIRSNFRSVHSERPGVARLAEPCRSSREGRQSLVERRRNLLTRAVRCHVGRASAGGSLGSNRKRKLVLWAHWCRVCGGGWSILLEQLALWRRRPGERATARVPRRGRPPPWTALQEVIAALECKYRA